MNPVVLVGAASLGLLGLGLRKLRRNDLLENPPTLPAFGSAESVVSTVAETLKTFSGSSWVWTVKEIDASRGILRAECLSTERDLRPVNLTARLDTQKNTLVLKFEVHALLGRSNINKVLERTYKGILFSLEEKFEQHMSDPALSIEELLTVLQEAREARLPLTQQQVKDLTRELERRAVKQLKQGETRTNGVLYIERQSESRIKIGRTRGKSDEKEQPDETCQAGMIPDVES